MTKCALWYFHYHSPLFDLCDDEADAVATALALADSGEGAVSGVQFADGRVVPIGEWTTYWTALDERDAREAGQLRRRQADPPKVTAVVVDPFSGRDLQVYREDGVPNWLGRPPAPELP